MNEKRILTTLALVCVLSGCRAITSESSARRYLDMFEISKQSPAAAQADLTHIRFYLLERPEVQEDLAVSPNQLLQIKQTYTTPYNEIPELNAFIANQKEERNAVPENQRMEHNRESARGIARLFGRYARERLGEILTPQQKQRLDQLILQTRGPVLLLVQTNLSSALSLTTEQIKTLSTWTEDADEKIVPELREFLRGFISGYTPGETQEARERKMKELIIRLRRRISERDAMLVDGLSDQQRKKWFDLQGKPLQIDWSPWDLMKAPFEQEDS